MGMISNERKLKNKISSQKRHMLKSYWQKNQFNRGVMPFGLVYEPPPLRVKPEVTVQDITEWAIDRDSRK